MTTPTAPVGGGVALKHQVTMVTYVQYIKRRRRGVRVYNIVHKVAVLPRQLLSFTGMLMYAHTQLHIPAASDH